MDLLDIAITTAVKGVISFYVRKSLEKVDKGLLTIVQGGDQQKIRNYITERGLESQITEVASQTLRNSFVLPTMPEEIATFEDRSELFQNVLQFGSNVSHKLKADVFLPGSV